jgi:hypothetical protein
MLAKDFPPVATAVGCIFTEDGKNKEDVTQVKQAKVMFRNKKQLLCSNNSSLEIKKKFTKSCIWNVALYDQKHGP